MPGVRIHYQTDSIAIRCEIWLPVLHLGQGVTSMKPCKRLFVGLVILLLALGTLDFLAGRKIGTGSYELTVFVHCNDELPSKVACCAISRREYGERICERLPEPEHLCEEGYNSAFVTQFVGEPIKMRLWLESDITLFRANYYHYRFLIVCAEWVNGRRMCKVVEIPEKRVSREIHVEIP